MESSWPFDQPPNCAVVSLRRIMQADNPVLLVSHDEEDHGWQFLDGQPPRAEELMLVTLSSVIARDKSLYDLADLPPGWQAWRASKGEPWHRERVVGDARAT